MKKAVRAILHVLHFVVSILLFTALSCILLIYHGPFQKLKENIVNQSMATRRNQFFSTAFLSRAEIDEILARTNSVVQDGEENVDDIQISKHPSTTPAPSGGPTVDPLQTGIRIVGIKEANFTARLIIIDDPSRMTIGVAPQLGKVGAPLSEIVKATGSLGGVNGGGFQDDNFMGTGANPQGIVIENGTIRYQESGLTHFGIIGFNRNDVLVISNSMSLEEIAESDLRCALSFGPALVLNGKPLVTKGGTSLQPRTAIAQRKDGTILLLCIDGRQSSSAGANLRDVQDLLLKYDAFNAANLDGGSSSTMNFLGKTINNPCDIAGERYVATAFLIKP